MEYIKRNWMEIVFGIVVVILGFYFISSSLKEKQMDIVNQQNCSKKAEEVFQKNKNGYIAWLSGSDYVNHFNKKINKCFVIIEGGARDVEYVSVLYDAYENKVLSTWHTLMDMAINCGLWVGDTYKICENNQKEHAATQAYAEYKNLIKGYMEN